MRRTAFLFLLFLWGCENYHTEFDEILRLENRRAPASDFYQFEMHSSAEVQKRAAIALGRLQDPDAVPMLGNLLESSNPTVRAEAAFSLGQLRVPGTHSLLLSLLKEEKDLEVQIQLLEALSKVADSTSFAKIDSVLVHNLASDIPILRAESALAMGRLAHHGFVGNSWSEKLVQLLEDASEEVRWRAAYALMRIADKTASGPLRRALEDRSERVRMQAARALGNIGEPANFTWLKQVAHDDRDWRVRVNAHIALGKTFALSDSTRFLETFATTDTNLHVRLTAIESIGEAGSRLREEMSPAFRQTVASVLKRQLVDDPSNGSPPSDWQLRVAAAHSYARLMRAAAIPELSGLIDHANPYVRAGMARALGETRSERAFPLLDTLTRDEKMPVRVAALEALAQTIEPVEALMVYRDALASGDPVLVAITARNLAADTSASRREAYAPSIVSAFQNLPAYVDIECADMIFTALAKCGGPEAIGLLKNWTAKDEKVYAQSAARALERIAGDEVDYELPRETEAPLPVTHEEIEALRGCWAEISTGAGVFELQFFWDEAPFAAHNFVELARQQFFDGQDVHRVVPNYVVQAGDPRGDMWGSPGYTLRSQFSRLRFVRGMVGMASVGPDTEGSQWFITHSDQPQLDGRYTIFARVRRGMEVVDRLQVGTKIERVVIHQ